MNRKTVIISETNPGRTFQAWGNLRKLCNAKTKEGLKGFKYFTVIKKTLPTTINNITISRVNFIE